MNAATPEAIHSAILEGWPMRLGNKLKRTLYLHKPGDPDPRGGICVGIVDSEELAEAVMLRWNANLRPHNWYSATEDMGS